MKEFDLKNTWHAHFVGIGGIGMSALARLLVHQGVSVSGSDREHSHILEHLGMLGISIAQGHDTKNVSDEAEMLIYSPAVPEDNPERAVARKRGIPEYSYPEALGMLSKHPFTIAVAGTHGKTTTTAMIAHVLEDTHVNPTVVVGSLLSGSNTNFVAGGDEYLLVEACEYRRSFAHLYPNILVITNIDEDHLDYYKDLDDIQRAFNDLVQKVPEEGFIVCDIEDERVQPALAGVQAGVVNYRSYLSHDLKLGVAGEHNRLNAAAAEAVADILGGAENQTHQKLSTFKGTWRRAEAKGTLPSGALLYDDYAHHPTEIKATLSAFAEQFPDKKLVVVFQPHLYSRTKAFLGEFAESFSGAEQVLLLPIYAAREQIDQTISHTKLAEEMQDQEVAVRAVASFDGVIEALKKIADNNTVVLTMGAGDVYKLSQQLLEAS